VITYSGYVAGFPARPGSSTYAKGEASATEQSLGRILPKLCHTSGIQTKEGKEHDERVGGEGAH
jgi:hypothetical protein